MPRTASTRRGQDRREALLRAALRVIGERGLNATTHRAIAEAAGVPAATTTYYFATLEELLEEALRLFVAEEVEALERATDRLGEHGDEPSIEELAQRVAEVLTAGHADERRFNGVAQFELYLEAARRPALASVAQECLDAYEAFACRALELVGHPRAAQLAPVFLALSDGLGLQRMAGRADGEPARRLAAGFAALYRETVAA